LGLSPDRLVVRHVDGAGCYGHNGADDAAMDAAVLALAVPGRPVQVVWSRPDELSWSPLGPAGVVQISADCGRDGTVLSWRHEIWSGSFIRRPGMKPTPAFLAAPSRASPRPSLPLRPATARAARRSARRVNRHKNAVAERVAMRFRDTPF